MKKPSSDRHPAAVFFDNRYLLVLTIIVTFVAGYSALIGLPRLEDPVIVNRGPVVLTSFPGATADRVESLVTEPLEEQLDEIDAIKNVESTSRSGFSFINIELKDAIGHEDLDPILSQIRDKLRIASANFPAGAQEPFLDEQRSPVAYTRIVSLRFPEEIAEDENLGILARRAEVLSDAFFSINGTQLVRIFGQPEEEIEVRIDRDGLAERGLSPRDLVSALRKADVKIPAGQLRSTSSNLLLEIEGSFDSVQRIREVIVSRSEQADQFVRVADVASVKKTIRQPPTQIAFSGNQREILIAARVSENERVDLWNEKVTAMLAEFSQTQGSGIQLTSVFEQNEYTQSRLQELIGNLLLGVVVVLAVIFLSMGWKRAFIVGLAIPLTAGATLFIISLQGGKLHQMSIFGMILGLGVLIDSAIVITDEVRKELQLGLSKRDAVIKAVTHLFTPLLSSTATSILAFLPILLLPGSAGDFVGSISSSVIIALTLSFFFSMTVIAALAGLLSNSPGKQKKNWLPRFAREGLELRWFGLFMRLIIGWAIRFPVLGIIISLIIPILGFKLAPTLGSQFFPRTDRDMFIVEIALPTTTAIDSTVKLAKEADTLIRAQDGFQDLHWLAGASFPPVYYNLIQSRDNSSFYASGIVKVDSFETTSTLVPALQELLETRFPQARIRVSKFAQGPPAVADVELRLSGPNVARLQQLGNQIQQRLSEHPDILYAEQTLSRGEPKLWFQLNEITARSAGFEPADVAEQLVANTEGLLGGSILEGIETLPVRVRLPSSQRNEVQQLEDLQIVNRSGQPVPLSAIGQFDLRPDVGAITRRNGQRVNTIQGYARIGSLPIDITNEIRMQLEDSNFLLPSGYELSVGGESENQDEAVGNLFLYLPIIVTLTIAILILSFKSLRLALILLLTAPLAAGFGLFATWTIGFPVSFNTILGTIGLIGLAFNDNIVVLAAIRSNPAARQSDFQAITEEVLACGRHLISTTLTTIGSFLPLLILIGGQFWPPLAIVLAGGVAGATLMAAFFTPAMYRLLHPQRTSPQTTA
ncbi:MAG: efflux RND transporter permease subunit [Verrucomicrobiota bacterium]